MAESKQDGDTKIFFRVSKAEREVIRRAARRRDLSMDAFLRTAAHLYLELPAGFDAEARTYARFLATAAPGRRKHIAEVIARELKTPADDDRLFEKPAGDLSEEELEAALERKRRSRELGDAFDKLNERG